MNQGLIHRKEFLRALVGAPMVGAVSGPVIRVADGAEATDVPGIEEDAGDTTAAFADRVVDDVGRTLLGALSYIGDRLGLFKSMAALGRFTAQDLAAVSGYNPRLLEEWLRGMVSLGYVLCDSSGKRFHFPPEHAAVLADEGSPYFKGGMVEYAIPAVLASHKVMEAFRTGVPITPDVFHSDYWEAIERWVAPDYRHRLVQQWLPLMPDVFRRLQSGGEVADVGCGSGRATITIAKAFPKTLTRGFDVFGLAIERAQKNAEAAGMTDRATFVVGGTDMLPEGQFDLITNFWVFHHYTQPVTEMKAIRHALAPSGSYLIAEDRVSSNPIENINPIGRVAYGASTLGCLHDSMADNGVGIGMASEEVVRQLGEQAGFAMIRRLPLDDPYVALYELKG